MSFYNVTDDDVEDFRTIAYLKNEMSLKDAIRETYGDIHKHKEYTLAQQLETLKEDFITLNDNFKNLYSSNKKLQIKFQRLEKEQEEILSTLELLPFGAWEKARRKFVCAYDLLRSASMLPQTVTNRKRRRTTKSFF